MQKTAAQHISKVTTPQKQRSFFGNKKDPGFFAPALIQPKLTVAPVNDPYEAEADAMADKVMRMPSTETLQAQSSPINIQRKCEACEAEEKLHRKEDDELEHVQMKPLAAYTIQRKCTACKDEEAVHRKENNTTEHIRLKPANGFAIQRQCAACEHEEQEINRKDNGPSIVPGVTPAVQQSLRSQGRPLDVGAKRFMESRFGCDFGDVQVHNDSLAHQSSKDIMARAYTHGKHIVFGEGQYQPETYAGKQLLAHELTHVVQQNGMVSRAPFGEFGFDNMAEEYYDKAARRVAEVEEILADYRDKIVEIDIQGDTELHIPFYMYGYFAAYILAAEVKGEAIPIPVKIKYGGLGSGLMHLTNKPVRITRTWDTSPLAVGLTALTGAMPRIRVDIDIPTALFSASGQVIPVKLPHLDTSTKNGSLVLNVNIDQNIISGKVGWLPGVDYPVCDPRSDYELTDFSNTALLPFIYGNDYAGDNFKEDHYSNSLVDGSLNILSLGELSLPNLQKIQGIFQTGDGDSVWQTNLVTNIMGAEEHQLPISRTDQGLLTGEDDSIQIGGEWSGEDFKAKGSLHTSFINSRLFVIGEVSYQTQRGEGKLFLAVTDYLTAKQYAIDYLPEEIQGLAKKDVPPPNADQRLAFVGAGDIKLILFDGKKKTKPPHKHQKDDIDREDDGKGDKKPIDPSVTAEATFVVEPEGYITVAGEIKQPNAEYELFEEAKYSKKIPLLDIPFITIPGPIFGSHLDVNVEAHIEFGAGIGPLMLSQLKASGIYSTRPDTPSELELSGLLQLHGRVFADLVIGFALKAGVGPFTFTVASKDIHFGASMEGAVSARPTIVIRGSDKLTGTPREYSITGNFDFDIAGGLAYQVNDRMEADATEKKEKDPKTYQYVNKPGEKGNDVEGGDITAPVDYSLGSEEQPGAISSKQLNDMSFSKTLNSVMKGRKRDDYFKIGGAPGSAGPTNTKNEFNKADYKEGHHVLGQLEDKTKTATGTPAETGKVTMVFTQLFKMMDAPHKLYIIVDMMKEAGKVKDAVARIEMASETEPLDDKIEREEKEIDKTAEPTDDFQHEDLAIIKHKAEEVKQEVVKLAKNDELVDTASLPQAAEITVPAEQYAKRYKEFELGKKTTGGPTNKSNQKGCPGPPQNIDQGDEVVFYGKYGKDIIIGTVIEIVHSGNTAGEDIWFIKYRPRYGRAGTSFMTRAYDDYCKPAYYKPVPNKECNVHDNDHGMIDVPQRYVNNVNYQSTKKAGYIKAFPLCWSTYLDPKGSLVGIDRINPRRKGAWHRAHLVNGKLGGKGKPYNLVPSSKNVNNNVMPAAFENEIKGLVALGQKNGDYYWMEVKVNYYKKEENMDIGHYEDFVKSVDVTFGTALPNDPKKTIQQLGEHDWTLETAGQKTRSADFKDEPGVLDILSDRITG